MQLVDTMHFEGRVQKDTCYIYDRLGTIKTVMQVKVGGGHQGARTHLAILETAKLLTRINFCLDPK